MLYYFEDMKIKKDIIFANNEVERVKERDEWTGKVCDSVTLHKTGQVQTAGEAPTILSSD